MYARVAKWEGADGSALRSSGEQLNERAASGPPEGVPAKGFLMLMDPESGRSLAISLFESEEDMRKGDETLNAMDPDPPTATSASAARSRCTRWRSTSACDGAPWATRTTRG